MRQNLLVLAQAYADATGAPSLGAVSKKIHGNHAFLEKFFAGEISARIDTYFLMVNRLRSKWPAGAAWPKTAAIPKLGKIIDEGFEDA